MVEKITTHQSEEDFRNKDILIYVNGEIVPRDKATISVYATIVKHRRFI